MGKTPKKKGRGKTARRDVSSRVLSLCLRFLKSADPTKSRSLEQATEYAMDFQAF